MKINVLTLFPEMFTPVTEASILGRAVDKGILDINLVNIRDYTLDKHRKTDDTPFGGGPGMVMSAQPIFDALRSLPSAGGPATGGQETPLAGALAPAELGGGEPAAAGLGRSASELGADTASPATAAAGPQSPSSGPQAPASSGARGGGPVAGSASQSSNPVASHAEPLGSSGCGSELLAPESADGQQRPAARVIYMSPRGRILDQQKIEELAAAPELTILCGHYEGVDQRVLDAWNMEEISIGDYILTGGELAAMVLIDSVSRFIPEVLGSEESATEESIYSGLLEFDQYTKPREYEGRAVPEVLFGGNHQEIHLWQYERSLALTKERRPDLFAAYLEKLGITGSAQVNPTPSHLARGITLGKHDAPSLTKQEKRILEKILNEE